MLYSLLKLTLALTDTVELYGRCIFAITMVLRIRKMRWCITDTKLCVLATSSTSMTIVLRRDWYEKNYAKEGE